MWKKFFAWFKKGKIKPTTDIPLQQRGETFKGFKITWPWWGDKKNE